MPPIIYVQQEIVCVRTIALVYIGIDVQHRTVYVGDKTVKLQIWSVFSFQSEVRIESVLAKL